MIGSIWSNIWNWINEVSNDFKDFIMNHYDEPFLWIAIFVLLLMIAYYAISKLVNK